MHICFATPEYLPHPGGIATYYSNLAQILSEAGHRVTILTTQPDAEPGHSSESIQIISIAEASHHLRPQLALLFPESWSLVLKTLCDGIAARSWLQEHAASQKIDVVACADFLSWGALLQEPTLPPVTVTCHGSNQQIIYHTPTFEPTDETAYIQSLEALALQRADAVNAYSPLNQQFWQNILERKVNMTRAPWLISSPPSDQSQKNTAPRGLVVGRLQTWKGPHILAQALRILKEKKCSVHIDWYGGDKVSPNKALTMSQYLTEEFPDVFKKSLHWHPPVPREEIIALQNSADYIIVPSTWDTFNFTALEALEKAKPIILSDACGASYLLNQDNGLTFKSEDPHQLAEHIQTLHESATQRHTLGQAARKTIEATFTPKQIAVEHLATFQSAIDHRQHHPLRTAILGSAIAPFIDTPLHPDATLANLDKFPAKNLIDGISTKIKNKIKN